MSGNIHDTNAPKLLREITAMRKERQRLGKSRNLDYYHDKYKILSDFPYLFDQSQEVAKAYTAACTPDLFLFDQDQKLVYRGQLDDSRPGSNIPVTGKDLRLALDAVLSGQKVTSDQKPSAGCSIKWKK